MVCEEISFYFEIFHTFERFFIDVTAKIASSNI